MHDNKNTRGMEKPLTPNTLVLRPVLENMKYAVLHPHRLIMQNAYLCPDNQRQVWKKLKINTELVGEGRAGRAQAHTKTKSSVDATTHQDSQPCVPKKNRKSKRIPVQTRCTRMDTRQREKKKQSNQKERRETDTKNES